MKYIIGSGWWCNDYADKREKFYGDDEIRGKDFHHLWYKSVIQSTSPEKIVIVDSNSPIIPEYDSSIEFISLNENAGHSTNHTGKFSGWMRSVLLSASYAINCDCDYYVYVEQDVLLKGDNIIEKAIESMNKPYMFGRCNDHHNPLQQSFFIIKKDYLEQFVSNIYRIPYTDYDMPPERKFAIATSKLFSIIPKFMFVTPNSILLKKVLRRIQNSLSRLLGNYDDLPFGQGRDRPIDFSLEHFYFQHGDTSELTSYNKLYENTNENS